MRIFQIKNTTEERQTKKMSKVLVATLSPDCGGGVWTQRDGTTSQDSNRVQTLQSGLSYFIYLIFFSILSSMAQS